MTTRIPSFLKGLSLAFALLFVSTASSAPRQDAPPPVNIDDLMKANQERLQEMMERNEERMREGRSQQGARPEQSALGAAFTVPTKAEREAAGFRPGVGLKVKAVLPGGPAAKAGLRPGDLIESLHGQWIFNQDQLVALIRCFPPGETVRIEGLRGKRAIGKDARLVRCDALPKSGGQDTRSRYDFQYVMASDRRSSTWSDSESSSSIDSDRQSSSSSSSDSDSDRQSSSSSSSDSDSDRQSSSSSSSSSDSDSDRQS